MIAIPFTVHSEPFILAIQSSENASSNSLIASTALQALSWSNAPQQPLDCHDDVMCRSGVPRVILGVHAAFHVLYMLLATFHREWALQQNLSRVQVRGSCNCSCCLLSL